MATEGSTGAATGPDTADLKVQLEQRYIQLLEQRIADLEALVKKSAEEKESESKDKDKDGKDEKGDKQDKSRIRSVIAKWDASTGIRSDFPVDDPTNSEDKGDIAFTFRKVVPSQVGAKDNYCEVDIESKGLQSLLAEIIGDEYPGQSWEGEIVNILTPFAPLIHYWSKLQEAVKECPEDDEKRKQAREDLARLMEHVKGSQELVSYFKTRESYLNANLTTYETMWSLFVPGKMIYAQPFMNTPQLFVVENPPYMWERERRLQPTKLDVDCWCYDWNGKEMVKVYYSISIERFRGTKAVNDLICYPIKYYRDEAGQYKSEEDLREMLLKRGRKYNKIVRGPKGATQMHQYKGNGLADRRDSIRQYNNNQDDESRAYNSTSNDNISQPPSKTDESRRKITNVKGNYIVDAEAYLNYGSGKQALGQLDPYEVEEKGTGDIQDRAKEIEAKDGAYDDLDKEYLLLLPPRFLGYSTQEKFWGQFEVDKTSNVSKERVSMFEEKLQLDSEYKQMIQALVNSHESKNNPKGDMVQVKDVVEDKGKGLVILLHGPPGVGKTLTAETIAEASGKPLFIVSVAEIGLNASKAEKNLEQMFALAGSWEAVLLVDEADVFLESRTSEGDPNRNALVSVLLRVLEYYQGIMILTTNRITSLDLAVQSRIHLAIRYEDLSKKYKQEIFKMFLDQLEPDCIKDHRKITEWIEEYGCDYKLNGRQIRNVVSSALALARSTAKENEGDDRLTDKHLKRVVGITKEFQEQLESITKGRRAENEVGRAR